MKTAKLQQLLNEAHETIHALQEELNETNRGLVALNMELDERVEQRTAELAQANEALRAEIAERKRVEEERERLLADRKQQSKFLESLINNAPIGVAVVDREMRYLLANPAYRSIAGAPTALLWGARSPRSSRPRLPEPSSHSCNKCSRAGNCCKYPTTRLPSVGGPGGMSARFHCATPPAIPKRCWS